MFSNTFQLMSFVRPLSDLSHFAASFYKQDIRTEEVKPSTVNQQCVVYHFACDLCDADYVDYTARHLFQRVAEHKTSQSTNIFMMSTIGGTF